MGYLYTRVSGLASVLHPSGDALHGQDQRVLQARRVLALGVQLHQLRRLALVDELLGQGRLGAHLEGRVTNPLQGVGLADVQGGDVRLTQPQTLLQVRIAFEDILVTGNLRRMAIVGIILSNRTSKFYKSQKMSNLPAYIGLYKF